MDRVTGVYISNTTKSGAADEAGLQSDDIILEVNGRKVASVSELQEIIGIFRPGIEVTLTYWRDGAVQTAKAVLKNQINSTELIATRKDPILVQLGFELRDLSEKENKEFNQTGVRVLSIYQNSKIFKTNMAPNYIITSVNNKKIKSVDELIAIINSSNDKITLDGFYEKYKGKYPYSFYKD